MITSDPDLLAAAAAMRRRVFVADSDTEAQEKVAAAQDFVAATFGTAFETADPALKARIFHPDDFAVGSPATVAEKLIELARTECATSN